MSHRATEPPAKRQEQSASPVQRIGSSQTQIMPTGSLLDSRLHYTTLRDYFLARSYGKLLLSWHPRLGEIRLNPRSPYSKTNDGDREVPFRLNRCELSCITRSETLDSFVYEPWGRGRKAEDGRDISGFG